MSELVDVGWAEELREIVGSANLISDRAALRERETATFATHQRVIGVVRPRSAGDLAACVRWANRTGVVLHPISGGFNWGYGSAVPPRTESVLVDLGAFDGIEIDRSRALVTVGAGVTQEGLYRTLADEAPELLHSVTGSSPRSSIVGNAVDGGSANGLHTVRWDHVIAANAVLGDGEIISVGYYGGGAEAPSVPSRYAPGPSLLGLLRQSALGIVTELTLEVPVAPMSSELLFFSSDSLDDLAGLVDELSRLQRERVLDGNWHICNAVRVLAEHQVFPFASEDPPLSSNRAAELLRAHGCGSWDGVLNGVAVVHAPTEHRIAGSRRDLADLARRLGVRHQLVSISHADLQALRRSELAGLPACPSVAGRVASFCGVQGGGTARVAYWRKPQGWPASMHLDRDGCGFIWLAMLFPPHGPQVQEAVRSIEAVAADHRLEAQVVVDGVSGRDVMLMTAIAYDRDLPGADGAAEAATTQMAARLAALGGVVFRDTILGPVRGASIAVNVIEVLARFAAPGSIGPHRAAARPAAPSAPASPPTPADGPTRPPARRRPSGPSWPAPGPPPPRG